MNKVFLTLLLFSSCLWSQSTPLILEHADEMQGSQSRQKVSLQGNILFKHDSLKVYSNSALWDTQKENVTLKGNVKFNHPAGQLKAKEGSYFKQRKLFKGTGNVWGRDSVGQYFLEGDTVEYFQSKDFLDLRKKAKITLLEGDSLLDTLTVQARHLTLSDSAQRALAMDSVVIHRGELLVYCDSADLNRRTGLFQLKGNPVAYIKGYRISGDYIEGQLKEQKLVSLKVINNARAEKDTLATPDSTETHLTEIYGDTLLAFFAKGNISRLESNSNSKGNFWEKERPDFKNRGSSDKMILHFSEGNPTQAVLYGEARTFYHLFEKQDLAGTNEAAGDSIKIDFGTESLKNIRIFGNRASGVFSGEKATSKDNKL